MTAISSGGCELAGLAEGMREILLAAIDLNKPFLGFAPPEPNLELLKASLAEVGMLAPPWLRPQAGGGWQAVTGWRRLQAAAQLGWERVPARTLPGSAPNSLSTLLYLYDNAFSRGFDLREQAALAARLAEHWPRATVASRFLPYLGWPPSPTHLDRLLKLAGLPTPFQQLAAQGRLALTAAALLADWEPPAQAAALAFWEQLHLSQSKQEEFLGEVALLARREGVKPEAVLSRPEIQQVLGDQSLNAPEKTAAVRRLLQTWVYPRFSAAKAAFQQSLQGLGLAQHPRMRLLPPPAFEGPDFQLELKFTEAAELRQLLEELHRLLEEPDFTKLTSP